MANQEHLSILRHGVGAWNSWRRTRPGLNPNLNQADLRRADLSWSDLSGTNLGNADLSNANLTGADLTGADLKMTNLRGAYLSRANLTGATSRYGGFRWADLSRVSLIRADLSWSDLSDADLSWSDLSDADLSNTSLYSTSFGNTILLRTNFTAADIGGTIFARLDLRAAIGLDTTRHGRASSIDLDTLLTSGPHIPLAFLRGCGLSDHVISSLSEVATAPRPHASCFISHSSHDGRFAEKLYADLQRSGVRCWFAPHDIQSGKKVYEQLDEAIRTHDRLLLIISHHSMNSEWVKTEIANARRRELSERTRLLYPISLVGFDDIKNWQCFDNDTGKDSAREVREYFIPDFQNWQDPSSYQAAFQRLLHDLHM